jgi:hypothetical protein
MNYKKKDNHNISDVFGVKESHCKSINKQDLRYSND